MAVSPSHIVYGVFKGMGDLLWAVPVITAELSRGNEVHLLVFPSAALVNFCSLVDFGPGRSRLSVYTLPRNARDALSLVGQLRHLSPRVVWISPHAPAAASSWKIPLALWTLKKFFWPTSQLVGSSSERLSHLFDLALPIDRKLPLKFREWSMYFLFRKGAVPTAPSAPRFNPEIMDLANLPPRFNLVIHPGATAKNRLWPDAKYPEVVALLPQDWKIAVLGLPEDIEPLEKILPKDRSIEFISGSLRQSLMTIASAQLLLVMDSGNVHFAEVLGKPAVALFGKENPQTIIPPGVVKPVYVKSIACQPCGLAVCIQSEPFCMTNLSAQLVADRLLFLAHERTTPRRQSDPSPLITIDFGR